jgi:hypothetical protein
MSFNFDNFIKSVHKQFENEFQIEEVKDILSLDENYTKDSPVSTGKRLIIEKLLFCGQKPEGGGDFSFSHKFNEGINFLIASNLKGKSSVFKIIKYALTGSKPKNIGNWLKHILLSFKINDKFYSVYLNLSGRNLKAKLINGEIDSYESAENAGDIWITTNAEDFELKMKEFFFNQFSYYSLKWTQKDSRKNSVALNESNTSWSTYFNSIYLESKDSTVFMFGTQETKVFEMLLGLELTYPINRLRIRLDYIQSKQAMQEDQILQKQVDKKNYLKGLNDQLAQKQSEYDSILKQQNKPIKVIDSSNLYSEYDKFANILNKENNRILKEKEKLNNLKRKENELNENLEKIKEAESSFIKEKELKEKKVIELKEYLETKIFFSNLKIQHCPNCKHSVSKEKKELQSSNHICSLCSEPISTAEARDAKENIEVTIKEFEKLISQYNNKIKSCQDLKEEKLKELYFYQDEIKKIDTQPSFNLEQIKQKIYIIESEITEFQKSIQPTISNNELILLIKDIGRLEGLLASSSLDKEKSYINYKPTIKLLEYAINELKLQRYSTGNNLISKLQEIMLSEVQRFGLQNISKISIYESMEIRYKQLGEIKKFEDFVEGEQLRLKIAFYLSLIQLDISENFGRHTRFLIIDSPTKEEGDDEYLGGLITELQTIHKQFKNDLQIFIGTANRSFVNQFENQIVIPKGKYVF